MTKQRTLEAVFNGLDAPPPKNPYYFLFLLGTDTSFTPLPTVGRREYDRGESLSITAVITAALLGEYGTTVTADPAPKIVRIYGTQTYTGKLSENGLSFSSESVDVVNGPDTFGHCVGERIAEGVLLILEQVAKGKSHIQITAHSRGAVEAKLVLAELERIRIALETTPDKSLREILLETSNNPEDLTKIAFQRRFPPKDLLSDTAENRAKLLQRINSGIQFTLQKPPAPAPAQASESDAVSVQASEPDAAAAQAPEQISTQSALSMHPFLHDPVPGGGRMGGWFDSRFYEPFPEMVRHYEWTLALDERTGFFKSIIAKGVTPTPLPGHHGTASGSFYTQAGEVLPGSTPQDIEGIQRLFLLKLLHFYSKATAIEIEGTQVSPFSSGVTLPEQIARPEGFEAPSGTQQDINNFLPRLDSDLKNLVKRYLAGNSEERADLLFKTYQAVGEKKKFYEGFRKKGYPPAMIMGTENAPDGSRFVHWGNAGTYALSAYIPQMPESIDNEEHAALLTRRIFTYNGQQKANELVKTIQRVLQGVYSPASQPAEIGDFEWVAEPTELQVFIGDEAGKGLFLESLSTLVGIISKKYLKNNIELGEKRDLVQQIKETFEGLDQAIQSPGQNATFLQSCRTLLGQSLKDTVENHFFIWRKELENLQSIYDLSENQDAFRKELNAYLLSVNLPEESSVNAAGSENIPLSETLKEQLEGFKQELQQATTHDDFTQKLTRIRQQLELSAGAEDSRLQQVEEQQLLIRALENIHVERLLDANNLPAQYYDKLNVIYENLLEISAGIEHFQGLLSEQQKINVDPDQIQKQKTVIAKFCGELLAKEGADLRTKPEGMNSELFATAKEYALAAGAIPPAVLDLQENIERLKQLLETQQQQFESERQCYLSRAQAQLEEQEIRTADAERALAQKQGEFDETQAKLEEKQIRLAEVERQLGELIKSVPLLEDLTKRQREQLSKQEEDLSRQENEIAALQANLTAINNQLTSFEAGIKQQESLLAERDKTIARLQGEANQAAEAHQTAMAELQGKQQEVNTSFTAQNQQQIEAITAELNLVIAEKNTTITRLQGEVNQAAQAHQTAMAKLRGEQQEANNSLIAQNQQQIEAITAELERQKEISKQLATVKERRHADLIENRLLPITSQYLEHLLRDIEKISGVLEREPGTYPSVDKLVNRSFDNKKEKENWDILLTKYQQVKALYAHLVNEDQPLPSKRVQTFSDALVGAHEALKMHRDGFWTRFFKACAIALAVVGTGILPGLLIPKVRNNLFFKSEGQQFVAETESELKKSKKFE